MNTFRQLFCPSIFSMLLWFVSGVQTILAAAVITITDHSQYRSVSIYAGMAIETEKTIRWRRTRNVCRHRVLVIRVACPVPCIGSRYEPPLDRCCSRMKFHWNYPVEWANLCNINITVRRTAKTYSSQPKQTHRLFALPEIHHGIALVIINFSGKTVIRIEYGPIP